MNLKILFSLAIFLLFKSTITFSQAPIQQFWILNQSSLSDTMIWDNTAWNSKIDNGSGTFLAVSPLWTTSAGRTNMKWASCKSAIFGGNTGVGAAGVVTLATPVNNFKSMSFYPAESGDFTISGQSIQTTCADSLPIFVAYGINPVISSTLIGTNSIRKNGLGTLTLTDTNIYSGATLVNEGTLALSNTSKSPDFTTAKGATLELNAASNFIFNKADMVFTGSGTIKKTGSATLNFGGAYSATWRMNTDALIDVHEGSFIGGNNTNDFWDNNFSNLNVASGALFNGVEANVRVGALTGAGTIKSGWNGAGYNTFTIGVNDSSGVFDGIIQDNTNPCKITKEGAGYQTFTQDNTYTGGTVVSGGILQIGNGGETGMVGTGPINDNAVFAINRNALFFSNDVSGPGNITVNTGPAGMFAEYLVVAGGGSGGSGGGANVSGGGGGAGGLLNGTFLLIGKCHITVGAGGESSFGPLILEDGKNSVLTGPLETITAIGGGHGNLGGGIEHGVGHPGGSGGGAVGNYVGGAGTAGQGHDGGGSAGVIGSDPIGGGGGGGAGGAGTNGYLAHINTRSAGGAGLSNSITGSAVVYAKGGAGGSSQGNSVGASGADNTGNGGDGSDGNNRYGGRGGDGVIIVAYPANEPDLVVGPGLTYTMDDVSRPGFKIYKFTSGDDDIELPNSGTVFTGDNTYSGTTTVNTGVVFTGHDHAFGTSDVTINGGEVRLLSNITSPVSVNNGAALGVTDVSVVNTQSVTFNDGSNYNFTPAVNGSVGLLTASSFTANNLTVNILGPLVNNPSRTITLMHGNTLSDYGVPVIGINNSGFPDAALMAQGNDLILSVGWTSLVDIYYSMSNNIAVTINSPYAGANNYTVSSGTLPTGLSMDNNGNITGSVPEVPSDITYTFIISANDAFGGHSHEYKWVVHPQTVALITSSQNWTPRGYSPTADIQVVVIGGGGGAGDTNGDGAGGGQVVEQSLSIAPNTTYALTVGAGGNPKTNGSLSKFDNLITATGGFGAILHDGTPYSGALGGLNNGQSGTTGNMSGQKGVAITDALIKSFIANRFGISLANVLLGAGGGGGTFYNSQASGGTYGGGIGGFNNSWGGDGVPYTGGGGGGASSNGGGGNGGHGAIYIRY